MTARKYGPICTYTGCGRPHNARGLCSPHPLSGENLYTSPNDSTRRHCRECRKQNASKGKV